MISYSIKHDFVFSAINLLLFLFPAMMCNLVLDQMKQKLLVFPLKTLSNRSNMTSFLRGRLEILRGGGLRWNTQPGGRIVSSGA